MEEAASDQAGLKSPQRFPYTQSESDGFPLLPHPQPRRPEVLLRNWSWFPVLLFSPVLPVFPTHRFLRASTGGPRSWHRCLLFLRSGVPELLLYRWWPDSLPDSDNRSHPERYDALFSLSLYPETIIWNRSDPPEDPVRSVPPAGHNKNHLFSMISLFLNRLGPIFSARFPSLPVLLRSGSSQKLHPPLPESYPLHGIR